MVQLLDETETQANMETEKDTVIRYHVHGEQTIAEVLLVTALHMHVNNCFCTIDSPSPAFEYRTQFKDLASSIYC